MKEKKIVAIAAATAAALCLSGCSFGYDKTGVARFVAPLSYGGDSIVPAEAPSVKLGKKQENLNAAQLSDTVFTAGATYEIKENYFIHEEYYFAIPTSWKGRLVYASNELDIVGYKMRSMEFAYRAPMKDENGNVTEVYCTVDMDSLSGSEGADRKIKGKTLHWVSAADAVPFEARLYDPLLADDSALEDETEPTAEDAVDAEETEEAEEADANLSRADYDFLKKLNQHSLTVVRGVIEPYAKECAPGTALQFLRTGYFCKDPDSTAELPVFNRTVGLRDAFAKAAK